MAKNCVLSPISAKTMSRNEAVKAAMLNSDKAYHSMIFAFAYLFIFYLVLDCYNGGLAMFSRFSVFVHWLNSAEGGKSL